MGKLGRFACILTPMLCTLASLVATVLLLSSGTRKSVLPSMYYIKVDVRRISLSGTIDVLSGTNLDPKIKTGITSANAQELGLHDFYTSYMWNYCSGNVTDNKWTTEQCEKPKTGYTFDVENIIAQEGKKEVTFPDSVKKVQRAVNVVSKFMVACYVLGAVATGVTFIVGWFGLLSRWGSCVTTIFADIAFGFLLVASICATVLAYSLKGAFNKAFDSFGVDATVGNSWISTTWIATAFAFAASVFWMMSMCCCSGRASRVMGDREGKRAMKVERTPYTYERVASPYLGGAGNAPHTAVPMQTYGVEPKPGFEPMRQSHV
jgi:hypothetical protein